MSTQTYKGDFISGQWVQPKASGKVVWTNPSDFSNQSSFHFSYDSIDPAVLSAKEAFKLWKKKSVGERSEFIQAFKNQLEKNQDTFVETISLETGKPAWEAKQEWNACLSKVDITLISGQSLLENKLDISLPGSMKGFWVRPPLGVCVVLGPYNFPCHLPNGHMIPALLSGNTVVFKPSEKTPLSGQLLMEAFFKAGFPPGVVNLVQGEKEVGRRLVIHPLVQGVFFTGSYEVGLRIKQDTLMQYGKLLALEMGGKNTTFITKDASLEVATADLIEACFLTAGQRCTSTSRIFVPKTRLKEFLNPFHEIAKSFKIGPPVENPFMGPLIDQSALDRYLKFVGMGLREGYEAVMKGKAFQKSATKGAFVTPSIFLDHASQMKTVQNSTLHQNELFSPLTIVVPYEKEEEALELINATAYGLICSVYTEKRSHFESLRDDLEFGLINWNRPTTGASSSLPFGGLKKSGNFQPAGLTSSRYTTYDQAGLMESSPPLRTPPPGVSGSIYLNQE